MNQKSRPSIPELKPCPLCGHKPDPDNLIDSLHSTNTYGQMVNDILVYSWKEQGSIFTVWEMNCLESKGGCGMSVRGDGEEEVIKKWNRRPQSVADKLREKGMKPPPNPHVNP